MTRKFLKFLFPFILLFTCLGLVACKAPESLATPENLRIENGTLLWDGVKYADGYYVYIDEEEHQTTECRYDLFGLDETEIHTIEVRAYSKKGIYSLYADLSYVGKYAIPTEGLEYKFYELGGNKTYSVTKFAVDENGTCVIPATYQGFPVTGFASDATSSEVLSKIKRLYLPHSISENYLTGFRMNTFPNLEEFALGGHEEKFIVEENCLIERATGALVVGCIGSKIPNYITTIGVSAFSGRNITKIDVPNSVTKIKTSAFFGCSQLTEIAVPNSVTEIGSSAFFGCTNLKKITIPNSVTELGSSAFSGCTNLKEITVPNSVTEMGDRLFEGCTLLEKAVLPERLPSARMNKTFSGCTSLKQIKIPEGVGTLNYTFENCTSLTDVTLPESAKSLIFTFAVCTSLKSVTLPAGITKMEGTFWLCSSLESVTIPGTVEGPQGVFYGCTSLKTVALDEGVMSVGWYLTLGGSYSFFGNCSSLTEVRLPSTLTKIDIEAFKNCTALKSILIPENVTRIWRYAFDKCPLEEVFYHGTEAEWEEIRIDDTGNETLLSATRYYYSETPPSESGNFWHYVDGVPTKWRV